MIIVVHGGAGKIPEEDQEERASVLREAAEKALSEAGPLQAVERAIRMLEAEPLFNAGYGGSAQLDGAVRLDAAVMTSDLSSGGVINVEGIAHPITLANIVREETPHTLLQGAGAVELGHHFDLELVDETKSQKVEKKWKELDDKLSGLSYQEKLAKLKELNEGNDTVGAVAMENGKLSAGTSTGGVRNQMKGRVGDSAIIGSGLYCNGCGAVSTTGVGEAIIKVNLARELVYQLERGLEPRAGAAKAVSKLAESTGSRAGLISLNAEGEVGTAHNTRDMQYAIEEG